MSLRSKLVCPHFVLACTLFILSLERCSHSKHFDDFSKENVNCVESQGVAKNFRIFSPSTTTGDWARTGTNIRGAKALHNASPSEIQAGLSLLERTIIKKMIILRGARNRKQRDVIPGVRDNVSLCPNYSFRLGRCREARFIASFCAYRVSCINNTENIFL